MRFFQKHKIPLILVSVLLSIALIAGIIFGTIALVRESRAVLSYHGVVVDEGMYAYFASIYKGTFSDKCKTEYGEKNAADTPVFFRQTEAESGKTYGELFEESLDEYVRSLIVSSYLFDRTVGLSKSDRDAIDKGIELILQDGKDSFEEEVKSYGFDYNSLQKCAKMLYKASRVFSLYASDTSSSAEDTASCDKFYENNYAHVNLLFIRTETVFLYDESGERIIDEETGYDAVRSLFDDEKAEREGDILALREAIQNLKDGKNGYITSLTIGEYLKKYYKDDSKDHAESGYYLSRGEGYTKNLANALPKVIDTALMLEVGDFAEVIVTEEDYEGLSIEGAPFIGSCFIYRDELPDGAYAVADFSEMFSSFYSGVGQMSYYDALAELIPEVKEGKRYGTVATLDIPYIYYYKIKF